MENENLSQIDIMERRYDKAHNAAILLPFSRRKRHREALWFVGRKHAELSFEGAAILDAGCGDGWFTRFMVETGAKVTGIDFSERAIEHAKRNVPEATFVVGSVTKLPFPSDSFDAVFSFQVIEHIPPDEVHLGLKELVRVLKPSGVCVISVPSVRRSISKAHFQHFTEKTFIKYLEPFFVVKKVVGVERQTFLFKFLEKMVENRWYHSHLLSAFVDAIFKRMYMEVSSSEGQNLLAVLSKR